MFAIFDPEVEWTLPDSGMNTGTFRGHEGVRELLESYLEAFEHFRIEPEESFETGERIVVFVRVFARGRSSGIDIETRLAHLWTMRAGKALRLKVFPEREQALEAAGIEVSG